MTIFPDAKVTAPQVLPGLVHRPTLLRKLDRVVDVGLVCAPAGYGKTVLLAQWVQAGSGVDAAWVRIDRDDDDPRRLWSAVLAALARCDCIPPGSPLRDGPDGGSWDLSASGRLEFLAELSRALADLSHPLRLVLDDLHEVTDPETLRGLRSFLRDRPRNVRVLLSGRLDPPLNLPRLRPEGRLVELRADDLRFSRPETEAVLGLAGVRLTPDQLDRLHRHTDGWPVGLRLAAVALTTAIDVDGFLEHFSGDERSVADYLVGEVLSSLSAETLDLLKVTSIDDPLPVGLAVALSGREDAGGVLAALERRTDLVRAVGRVPATYRVQPLIRTYMLADLNRQAVHAAARLHATAARWWVGQGRPTAALEHAARAEDPALLTDLVRRHALPLLLRGEHRPLRRAVLASSGQVEVDPWLSLVTALVRHEAGEPAAAEAAARCARRNWPDEAPADLAVLRAATEELAVLSRADGEGGSWGAGASLPDDDAVPAEPGLEALARVARCAARLRTGDEPDAVRRAIDALLVEARCKGQDFLKLQCLSLAAAAAWGRNDLRTMRETAAEAVAVASAGGWQASPWALAGTSMLAYGKLLAAEPEEAGRLAAEGLAHGAEAYRRLRFGLAATEATALIDLGDRVRGIAALERARTVLADAAAGPAELAAAAMAEFDAAMRLGRYTTARTVQCWLVERVGETAEVVVMRARTGPSPGRDERARATLRRVLAGEVPSLLPSTLVDALLQETALATNADNRFAARKALQSAVEIAEPLDLLRPFAQAGPGVRDLLAQRYGSREAADTFGGRALACGAHDDSALEVVLSRRELAVLALLPSLQSLDEIAADLTVSVNTVKSHVRSIYSKLGVSSRRSAVLTAYEHGLNLHPDTDDRAGLPESGTPARFMREG